MRSGILLPSPQKIFERYEKVPQQENILLVGSVGAGKSATINTIVMALSGERVYRAPVGSKAGESGRRTSTHLIWYKKCGIDEKRCKEMRTPDKFPNLVDMTGLANEDSPAQRKLLDMIITGRIWDKTSIPAIQDVQRAHGDRKLEKMFKFIHRNRRIHKILFVASATDSIPKQLIECVKSVAQPDGSAENLNPRYIPMFGILTKTDIVDSDNVDIKHKETEFLECLGINSTTSYSQWTNITGGTYSSSTLEFLDKLLSPDVRYVLDEHYFPTLLLGDLSEDPRKLCYFMLCVTLFSVAAFYLANGCIPYLKYL